MSKAITIDKTNALTKAAQGKKMSKIKKIVLLSLLATLLMLGVIYIRLAFYYRTHFFQGTMINGIAAGGKSVEQTEQLIASDVGKYQLKLKFRGDQSQILNSKTIGYQYVSDGSVSKLMESQNSMLWPLELMKNRNKDIHISTEFDQAKLTSALQALPQLKSDQMIAPSDAFVEFRDNAFLVVPENQGTQLDFNTVEAGIKDAVNHSRTTLDVNEIPNAYAAPAVLSTDTALKAEADQMNSLVKASITYKLPNGEQEVLDGNTLRDWLTVDANGRYSKNDETWNKKIKAFVANLANKINTAGKPRQFNATGLGEITVSRGNYGYKLNQKAEIAKLTEELNSGTIDTREPVWSSKELTSENNGFGKNYIEVDISRQHLWVYQDGAVTLESDIVTGRMTKDRYTPSGVYTLTYKEKDRDLKGTPDANGVPSYISHVNYWMPFNGGVGFHDASWRSNFGKNIYVNSGSHGCINLPTSFAPKLYQVINKDMPIVVYYSNGCSLEA